ARPGTVVIDSELAAQLENEPDYEVARIVRRPVRGLGIIQPYVLRRNEKPKSADNEKPKSADTDADTGRDADRDGDASWALRARAPGGPVLGGVPGAGQKGEMPSSPEYPVSRRL